MTENDAVSVRRKYKSMRERYRLSPIHQLFGLELGALRPGSATVGFSSRAEFQNVYGALHGGAIATILDSALLQSVRTLVGEHDSIATLEMKVNYLAPAHGQRFTCRGTVIRLGGSIGVAESRLYDSKEQIVAACLGTLHLKRHL